MNGASFKRNYEPLATMDDTQVLNVLDILKSMAEQNTQIFFTTANGIMINLFKECFKNTTFDYKEYQFVKRVNRPSEIKESSINDTKSIEELTLDDLTLDFHQFEQIRNILRKNQEKLVAREDWEELQEETDVVSETDSQVQPQIIQEKASRTSDINEKMTGQENVLRWFRGEFKTNQEAKKELGINAIVEDGNWFDYIMLWSQFFVLAGYKGFIILIDELAYICNTANGITRQNNYEKILMMYNAALQGKAEYLGIIMGGIPKSIYDKKKGIFSYEAMRSRLSTGSYQDTGIINMMTPIIKVFPLTKEEMYVLLEKLAEIHAQLYEYEKVITEDEMIDFVKLAYLKRETTFITPRTMIRDFIQILDVKRQNPDKGIRDILSAYKFAVDEEQTYEDND